MSLRTSTNASSNIDEAAKLQIPSQLVSSSCKGSYCGR